MNRRFKRLALVILMLIIPLTSIISCNVPEPTDEATTPDKMEWWRAARFGMFIHWGLYAVPAGEWEEEQIPGISEWIMLRAQIPVAEYEALTTQFNPVQYDADAWVRLAKEAGMKYIVITSKHHDGFAMYHSQVSPYNIVDATPFDRDPIRELAEACERHGLKLGFYHSQAQDWHHPGGAYRGVDQGEPHWDPALQRVPFEQYIAEKAYPQAEELLSNYGDIAIMWWDTPYGMTEPTADTLNRLLELQPGIIANNRLYGPWPGDFSTPEQHIPPTGLDYDWEVCMTMNTSWGYKHYDQDWKSTETLIQYLTDIASKGGNFLLNVGPTAEGVIPQPSVERLQEIGAWMRQNGESIYGTTASPFFKLIWGRATKVVHDDGATLYLHVFDWPADGRLRVPGLRSTVTGVTLLASGEALTFTSSEESVVIDVPDQVPDAVNTVIKLEIEGALQVDSNMPAEAMDGSVLLPATLADIYNRGYGIHAVVDYAGEDAYIRSWVDEGTRVEWMFHMENTGALDVTAELACEDGPIGMRVSLGDQEQETTVACTGSPDTFFEVSLGQFSIVDTGDHVIEVRPVAGQWHPIRMKALRLTPVR